MKKLLLCLAALLLLALPALADEAKDITADCAITVSGAGADLPKLTDGDYATYWSSSHRGYIEIASAGEKICGLYVSWARFITDWTVEALVDGEWQTVCARVEENDYYNQYIPLTEGYDAVRLVCQAPDFDHVLNVSEVRVLGAGELPAWVQTWKTFEGKADIVLLVTDPGDEYLFFGGLIPACVAEGRELMLCVVVNTDAVYKCQLLDGLWRCGLTNYPYIAYFKPNMASTRNQQYEIWSEIQFVRHVTRIVRMYKPDVLVTHATDGEGIDGGHKVCADAAIRALSSAMDSQYDVGYGYALWGNWQLKKLYLHLYGDDPTVLDYDQPLDFYGGKTAREVAQEAYALQGFQRKRFPELTGEGVLDGSAFGLYFSSVGEDEAKNSLFEHLD
ncbi:MAG: hypothetical protein IJS53_01370 [Clostridia bacterium]|nr:hypothetical protein [Clostridia bacterium]